MNRAFQCKNFVLEKHIPLYSLIFLDHQLSIVIITMHINYNCISLKSTCIFPKVHLIELVTIVSGRVQLTPGLSAKHRISTNCLL